VSTGIAHVVAAGLAATPKRLPSWLFYDAAGSALFERITELPEYYLTRAERAIFTDHADAIVAALGEAPTIVELGAGTADKTRVLLAAAARRGPVTYVPVDVSGDALAIARDRLAAELPAVQVVPWCLTHDQAFARLSDLRGPKAALFIGSSIGNYEDADAVAMLAGIRRGLVPGDALLLGTDLRKDPALLVAAYDDAAGVTAAFNKNLLVRINRELGGRFDVDRFRHVALWNGARSRMEMHLESLGAQEVRIDGLGLRVRFADRERIYTESSVKYDDTMVDGLLAASAFARARTWLDSGRRFAVHHARAI
jgi:dimethylhistidine N-methyltransferase